MILITIYIFLTLRLKEEVLIANHSQQDAEFEGYELSIGIFDLYQGELAVSSEQTLSKEN